MFEAPLRRVRRLSQCYGVVVQQLARPEAEQSISDQVRHWREGVGAADVHGGADGRVEQCVANRIEFGLILGGRGRRLGRDWAKN